MKSLTKLTTIGIRFVLILCFTLYFASAFSQEKSSKRGIAYGYHSTADMKVISPGICWWYNWSHQPETAVSAVYSRYDIDFVPMTWNGSFNESGLRAFYSTHPEARYLLGFNEPNFTTQANMKPSQAAAIWPKLEKIAKDFNLKIVSPAVNYADKPVTENGVTYSDPVAYLDAFFAACPDCQVDYIGVHNYMCYTSALSSYIDRFKKYKKPIWLTEFACWDQTNISPEMQKNYMVGAIDYLESDSTVFRYSWFNGNRSGAFPYLDIFKPASGELTDLGKLYVGFNPSHDPENFVPVPARIEAENYSAMSGVSVEPTTDSDGLVNVTKIDGTDWLEFSVEVPETADYTIHFRLNSTLATSLEIRENNVKLIGLRISNTTVGQNWQTFPVDLNLSAGKHTLQIYTGIGGFKMNWLEITKVGQQTQVSDLNSSAVRFFPNPVKDVLTIESGFVNGNTEISVLDLTGRKISSHIYPEGLASFYVDFSSLKSGSYLVRLKNNENISSRLIVK